MKIEDLSTHKKTQRAAGILIMVKNSREFLFILRSDKVSAPLTWAIPGGSVEDGEEPVVGACREVYEETGYKITPDDCHLLHINNLSEDFKYFTYFAVIDKAFKPDLNWENTDFNWCSLEDVPEPVHFGLDMTFSGKKTRKRLKELMNEYGA
jgi:uncharacterized protein